MKLVKRIAIAVLLLGFVAATTTACNSNKVCMAKKVGNHR